MAIFGYDDYSGGSQVFVPDWARGNRYDTDQHTASTGDVITNIRFFGRSNAEGGEIILGVYTTDGDVPDVKLGESDWIVSPTENEWINADVNIPLTNGVEYTLVMNCRYQNHTTYAPALTDGMSVDEDAALPAIWEHSAPQHLRMPLYAIYEVVTGAPRTYWQIIW